MFSSCLNAQWIAHLLLHVLARSPPTTIKGFPHSPPCPAALLSHSLQGLPLHSPSSTSPSDSTQVYPPSLGLRLLPHAAPLPSFLLLTHTTPFFAACLPFPPPPPTQRLAVRNPTRLFSSLILNSYICFLLLIHYAFSVFGRGRYTAYAYVMFFLSFVLKVYQSC